MENIVLSIEQMKELETLGIDTSNATMLWTAIVDADYNPIDWIPVVRRNKNSIEELRRDFPCTYKEGNVYYAYTLNDILKILPKKIDGGGWVLSERYSEIPGEEEGAYIWYGRNQVGVTNGYTPLTAAFNMLKWCKENQYI